MIRLMEEQDLPQVDAIEQQCFRDPWTLDSMRYEIEDNPFSQPYVLIENDELVGYAHLWIMFEQAQLANIAIAPTYRNQNKGSELLGYLLERARNAGCETMTLEVRASNEPARALYEKFGFTPINVAKRYYSDGEDAIVMAIGF
ncbi:MAG: ribosomal protein S18-alanine N-acetyltransferase [Allobaculum sp.]